MSKIAKNRSDDKRKDNSWTINEVSVFFISMVIIIFSLLVLTDSPITKNKSANLRNDNSRNSYAGTDARRVELFNQNSHD